MKRRYQPYPDYIDSGVEWLGQIPAHWDVRRLKFVAGINPSRSEVAYLPGDVEVSFLPMERVGYGSLDLELRKPLAEVKQGFTYFRDGDVLVAKITPSFENGKGALAFGLENGIGFGTTELHVIRATQEIDRQFLFYLTFSHQFRGMGETQMFGTAGQKRVPDSFINNFPTPLPPLPEQRAIAAFLDRETARIDALIARKRELIDLLRRQRTALISHAVTKGLDPSAPLKDSGVEWLGKIPAHWDVLKLKWLSKKIGSGKTPKGGASNYVSSGVIFLRSQNVHFSGLRLDDVVYIPPEIDRDMASSRVHSLDVLLNITGASLGRCSLVPENFPPANVNQHVCIIRPYSDRLMPKLLNYALMSDYMQFQIFANEDGISREGLNFRAIGNMIVAVPPLAEQRAISEYLDRETARIDRLIGEIEESIALLQRQRTALISAAVTGKIDVREQV